MVMKSGCSRSQFQHRERHFSVSKRSSLRLPLHENGKRPLDDAVIISSTQHGVRLAAPSLPIRKHTDVVTVRNGRQQWLHAAPHGILPVILPKNVIEGELFLFRCA